MGKADGEAPDHRLRERAGRGQGREHFGQGPLSGMHRPQSRGYHRAVACVHAGPAAVQCQIERVVRAIFGVDVPHAVGQQTGRPAQPRIIGALSGEYRRNPLRQRITMKGKPAQPFAFKTRGGDKRVVLARGGGQLFKQQSLTQAIDASDKLAWFQQSRYAREQRIGPRQRRNAACGNNIGAG